MSTKNESAIEIAPNPTTTSHFEDVSKILATILGTSFILYIIGWFMARTYFSALGAPWLVHYLPDRYLLFFSTTPIVFLFFVFVIALVFLKGDDGTKEKEKVTNLMIGLFQSPIVIYIGILLAFLIFENKEDVLLWSAFTLAVVVVIVVFRHLRRKSVEWGLHAYNIVCVGVLLLIGCMGYIADKNGARDTDEKRSELSFVTTTGGEKLRFLFIADGKIYAAKLSQKKPIIKVIEVSQVNEIVPSEPVDNAKKAP